MRKEHWGWLGIFLLVSLSIHLLIGWLSRSLGPPTVAKAPGQLVITLLPPPVVKAKPIVKPPPPTPRAQTIARTAPRARRERVAAVAPRVHLTPRVVRRVASASVHAPQRATMSAAVLAEQPQMPQQSAPIRMVRLSAARPMLAGGASPALGQNQKGSGPVAPETPPDDVLWNGGGRGGANLPKVASRAGGGGGLDFMSVRNPLGTAVPDDTPGAGPGLGGGAGAGRGGGMGFARLHGVGTALNGRRFAALHTAIGSGLGASHGTAQGTFRPAADGGGAEMPGTGGFGAGYGTGHGAGYGTAFRPGNSVPMDVADNTPSGDPAALDRGIPFGDIPGLLGGGSGASGGHGGVLGGGTGTLHIVYLLDVSGSMRVKNKTGKARDALKTALSQLKRSDWFNIICFDAQTYPFAPAMQKATPANVARADTYIDAMPLDQHPGTNMSQALGTALNFPGATHIFMMSDGEPQWGGITDFTQLRQYVAQQNTRKIPIFTLALGVGEKFKGMTLMRGIAQDNNGTFNYINLSADTPTTTLP